MRNIYNFSIKKQIKKFLKNQEKILEITSYVKQLIDSSIYSYGEECWHHILLLIEIQNGFY
jgi:hypothetical protein